MNISQAELLIDNRATHGEGPVWHDGVLYWVDLTGCRLHAWTEADGTVRDFQFQEPVCAVAPVAEGRLLIAFAKRLAYANLARKNHSDAAHLANHLAARAVGFPHQITGS